MRSPPCLLKKYLIKSCGSAVGNHTTQETSRDESKSVWYSDLRTITLLRDNKRSRAAHNTFPPRMSPTLPHRRISDVAISANSTSLQDFWPIRYRRVSEIERKQFERDVESLGRITA